MEANPEPSDEPDSTTRIEVDTTSEHELSELARQCREVALADAARRRALRDALKAGDLSGVVLNACSVVGIQVSQVAPTLVQRL